MYMYSVENLSVFSWNSLSFLWTEAPDYFIELMNDKNSQIAKLSSIAVTCLAVRIQLLGILWVDRKRGWDVEGI